MASAVDPQFARLSFLEAKEREQVMERVCAKVSKVKLPDNPVDDDEPQAKRARTDCAKKSQLEMLVGFASVTDTEAEKDGLVWSAQDEVVDFTTNEV